MTTLSPAHDKAKPSSASRAAAVSRQLDFADDAPAAASKYDDHNRADAVVFLVDMPARFAAYRNFAKNEDSDAAQAVHAHVKLGRAELEQYVEDEVRSRVPDVAKYNKRELLDLVVVAHAIETHGMLALAAKYERGEMDGLQNIALHSYDLRNNRKQAQHREQSQSKYKDDKHVAHYVGIEVIVALNKQLAPSERLSDVALERLVNPSTNFRMVNKATNLTLHKAVDHILLDNSALPDALTAIERKRVAQIAKVVQSDAYQQAFIAAGAQQLYNRLRDRVKQLDHPEYATLWDRRKDQHALRADKEKEKPTPKADDKVKDVVRLKQDGSSSKRVQENKAQAETSVPAVRPASAAAPRASHSNAEPPQINSSRRPSYAASSSSAPPAAPVSVSSSVGPRLKKDGTPDLRFKENKLSPTVAASSSYSSSGSRTPAASTASSGGSSNTSGSDGSGRTYFTGPRGGTYYINSKGNKVYVK